MTGSRIRIWHQSFTVLENVPDYAATLRTHLAKVSRPGTEVVLHGMHPATYTSEYPGNDIRHSTLYSLHATQFLMNGLAAQGQGYDAYAISTLPDPLLWETRSVVDIPVVAYGETSMHLACQLGQRFGILVFIEELIPLLEENVRRYGLASRRAAIQHVGFRFHDVDFKNPGPSLERFRDAARRMIADGADVLIPGEAVLCALLASQGLTRVDDVPVVDALAATVKMAETMVELRRVAGLAVSRKGYFTAAPPPGRVAEVLRFYGLDRLVADRQV